jgi:hypothetical protein
MAAGVITLASLAREMLRLLFGTPFSIEIFWTSPLWIEVEKMFLGRCGPMWAGDWRCIGLIMCVAMKFFGSGGAFARKYGFVDS